LKKLVRRHLTEAKQAFANIMGHGRIVFQGKPADFAVRKEWLEV